MKKRNYGLDFWKLFYIFVIIIYHFFSDTKSVFPGGAIGVEFFLLTSGYLFYKSCNKGLNDTPVEYFMKRFKRFFPWTIVAFVSCAIVQWGFIRPITSFDDLFDEMGRYIWSDVLLIGMNGLQKPLNVPAWTISSLLLVQFIMYSFLYTNKTLFINLLLSLTLLIGSGIFVNLEKAPLAGWIGYTMVGTLRAWIGVGAGYYCLLISDKLKSFTLNMKGKALLTTIEFLSHGIVIYIISTRHDTQNWRLVALLLFVIAVSIETSGHSLFCEVLSSCSCLKFMGPLSMDAYLMQISIIRPYRNYYPDPTIRQTHFWEFIGVLIIVSGIYHVITMQMIKFCRGGFEKSKENRATQKLS